MNGQAAIIEADILASNGILHIIEPTVITGEPLLENPTGTTVYDFLKADARFSRFVEAIDNSAWAVEVLQGKEVITIFAPTNEALAGHAWLNYQTLVFSQMLQGIWSWKCYRQKVSSRAYGNAMAIWWAVFLMLNME